jgi:CubicO group peptidase (beta-lactamase class C family)
MYIHRSGIATAVHRVCDNAYAMSPNYDSGGAGLFATVDDYIKVLTTIACGGTTADGYSLLKPETIAMMQKNLLCDDALNDFVKTRLFGYGWGLCGRVHTNPTISLSASPVGEFGWDGAAAAFALIDPANRVAMYLGTHVRSCQLMYHVIHPQVRNLAYEGLKD